MVWLSFTIIDFVIYLAMEDVRVKREDTMEYFLREMEREAEEYYAYARGDHGHNRMLPIPPFVPKNIVQNRAAVMTKVVRVMRGIETP